MARSKLTDLRFSGATAAALIDVVADVYTHGELDVVFIGLDAEGQDLFENGERGNKLQRVSNVVTYLRHSPRKKSEPCMLDLVKELLEERVGEHVYTADGSVHPRYEKLIASLRADGFEFKDGMVVRSTPDPAAMAPEMSALEQDLDNRGFTIALKHYRQAIDSHRSENLEASNGQLRSFLENLLIEVCTEETGKIAKDPKGAVDRLVNAAAIDGDEAQLLKGLLGLSNKRGAHHGLTDEEEALFRLHFSTAAARYLLAVTAE
jgi:hypothetical protein